MLYIIKKKLNVVLIAFILSLLVIPIISSAEEDNAESIDVSSFTPIFVKGLGDVSDMKYSPDGSELAVSSVSDFVYIYSTSDFSLNRKFTFYNQSIGGLCWHPNEDKIAVSIGKEIRIINSQTGRKISSISGYDADDIKWSSDGSKIALSDKIYSYNNNLRILNVDTGSLIFKDKNGSVDSWDSKNNYVSTYRDNELTIINLANNETIFEIIVKIDSINFLAPYNIQDTKWSPDGTKIAYMIKGENILDGKTNFNIQVLDFITGEIYATSLLYNFNSGYWDFIWSADSNFIISSPSWKNEYLFDLSNITDSKWLNEIEIDIDGYSILCWSPDSKNIAAYYNDEIKIFNSETFEIIDLIEQDDISRYKESLSWSPDDKEIAYFNNKKNESTDANMGIIKIINPFTGEKIREFEYPDAISIIDWSPVGEKILYSSSSYIKIVSSVDGQVLFNLSNPDDISTGCALWSPDGTKIATISPQDKSYIWDASTGSLLHSLDIPFGRRIFNPAAWSPDSKKIAIGEEDSNITIWDAETGEEFQQLSLKENPWENYEDIFAVAWSPDGKYIAGSFEMDLIVWDAETGEKIKFFDQDSLRMGGGSTISKIEWGADSGKIAALGMKLIIWDLFSDDVKILDNPSGVSNHFENFQWSNNGKYISTVHNDEKIRIWDSPADISIGNSDITISKENPQIGDDITISAKISNIGNLDASDFWVDFYVDEIKIDEQKIDLIEKENGQITLQTKFTLSKNNHDFEIIIDPDNFISEYYFENNQASKTIAISNIDSTNFLGNPIFIILIILILIFVVIYLLRRLK
jgi:WD40 repeat protein